MNLKMKNLQPQAVIVWGTAELLIETCIKAKNHWQALSHRFLEIETHRGPEGGHQVPWYEQAYNT